MEGKMAEKIDCGQRGTQDPAKENASGQVRGKRRKSKEDPDEIH